MPCRAFNFRRQPTSRCSYSTIPPDRYLDSGLSAQQNVEIGSNRLRIAPADSVMASATVPGPSTPNEPPSQPRNHGQGGGRGRGRGRGGFQGGDLVSSAAGVEHRQPNNRGGRRGGRGGNRGGTPGNANGEPHVPNPEAAARLAALKRPDATSKLAVQSSDEAEDSDAEECFICASSVVHSSLTPCNHRTCHICSLRMRALYKQKECAHCRASTSLYRVWSTANAKERHQRIL